jgi:hypothetical protein
MLLYGNCRPEIVLKLLYIDFFAGVARGKTHDSHCYHYQAKHFAQKFVRFCAIEI